MRKMDGPFFVVIIQRKEQNLIINLVIQYKYGNHERDSMTRNFCF